MKRKKSVSFKIGCVLLAIVALLMVFGIVWTPFDPEAVDTKSRYLAPSFKHLFGTDNLGRDVLSRVMAGAKTTLFVAAGIILIGGVIGTLVGLITGYYGGIVDEIIMRINDGLASFPSILLAVICVAVIGSNTATTVVALGILFIPSFARVIRSECLREKEKDYITNLKIWGAGGARIMFRHILPNTKESLVSAVIIGINNAIIAESSLSFLGLGVQPPTPSLGRMMSDGQGFILMMPWVTIFPGITIVLVVLGLSLVAKKQPLGREYHIKGQIYLRNEGVSYSDEHVLTKESDTKEKRDLVLKIQNLRVSIDNEILHGVSFSVKHGEVLGIVGESGSGKSTIASATMEALSDKRGLEITEVFQEPFTALDPLKKIGYQLREVALRGIEGAKKELTKEERKKACEEKILKTLERVELKDTKHILNSYPNHLSGGERQRVLIAMAIINEPKLIICDEPTTALDKDVEVKILDLLLKLKKELNLSLIFISHDISIVKKVSDSIIILKDGRFSIDGAYRAKLLREEEPVDYKALGACEILDENAIEAHALSLYYTVKGEKHYVQEKLEWAVKKGTMLGIKGGSGCGKSTLLKAICELIPYEGEIIKNERPSMVFQDPYSSLDPRMKLGNMLIEALEVRVDKSNRLTKEEMKRKALEMLKAVGLKEEYINRYPSELSGGERQRVAIACALIASPKLVLLDEPVTALDVTTKDAVMRLLMELKAKNQLTYIMVSHDEELLLNSCDEIIKLEKKTS